jgi:hypothetical protein
MRRALLAIYVAMFASALFAGAASAATEPAVTGAVSNSGSLSGTTAVAVSGHYAYAVSYWSGQLNVLDISNPASPQLVASTSSTTQMTDATNVTIAGNYAFVTSKNRNASMASNDDGTGNSLTVVDITNPLVPVVKGMVRDTSLLFGAYAVAVLGHYAFVASQGRLGGQPSSPDTSLGVFSVIDLTTPATPTIVAHIDNSSLTGALTNGLYHATGIAISGNHAYVTAFLGQRLTTIDISNPTSPTVVASLHDAVNLPAPDDVATQGSYAYVANQVGAGMGMEFTILNISNPAAPTVVGSLTDNSLDGAYRVRVRGNFAYVSANNAGAVAAVDVSNPAAPRLAGAVTDPRLTNVTGLDVSSTGRYVVAAAPRHASDPIAIYPPYPFQTGGPTVSGTVSVIDLEPSALSVSIASGSEPANLTSQTSANFNFAVSDAVTTVQCSLDGGAPGRCTTPTTATYGQLGAGTHTFTVIATDATGATARAAYTWTIAAAPRALSAPKISGAAQQGHTLKVSTGVWSGSPAPTYGYQWERCSASAGRCKSIANQTRNAYTVTAADVGSRLEVVIKATNSAGSATATSATTKTVTWSSSVFASATLSRSKTKLPGISLTVPAPGGNLKLKQIVLSLPKGISFAGTKLALAAGITVRDLRGHRLGFTASLSHRKLTLKIKKPPTGLKITVARGLVSISAALESRIRSGKAGSEKLSLTVDYAGKPARRGAVKFRLM